MSYQENAQQFAIEVKSRRLELHIPTARALAERVGVSPRLVGDIENGRRNSYSDSTLLKLDKALLWLPGTSSATLAGVEPPQQAPIEIAEDEQIADATTYSTDVRTAVSGNSLSIDIDIPLEKSDAKVLTVDDIVEVGEAARDAAFLRLKKLREASYAGIFSKIKSMSVPPPMVNELELAADSSPWEDEQPDGGDW